MKVELSEKEIDCVVKALFMLWDRALPLDTKLATQVDNLAAKILTAKAGYKDYKGGKR